MENGDEVGCRSNRWFKQIFAHLDCWTVGLTVGSSIMHMLIPGTLSAVLRRTTQCGVELISAKKIISELSDYYWSMAQT